MAFVSAFKIISFSPASQYVADARFNSLTYKAGTGIQFIDAGVNTSQINANVFAEFEVAGQNLSLIHI